MKYKFYTQNSSSELASFPYYYYIIGYLACADDYFLLYILKL